jgi:DNA replication and repair protein RecF
VFALQKISLVQFKNYHFRHFDFEEKLVVITGANGTGKTNLLDAIHYLCFTKSYFHATDSLNIQHDTHGFRIEGIFCKEGQTATVSCVLKEGMKKEFRCNEVVYSKFSHHIGLFPAVMIAPDDVEIINESSEIRRRWLDTILCQLDIHYLDHLITYQKVLQQRNSLLKQMAEHHFRNNQLLDTLDEQLIQYGKPVFQYRKSFLQDFVPVVQEKYNGIADNNEIISIIYESHLQENEFNKMLQSSREKDLLLQRTTQGIHRDDLAFSLNDYPLKTNGSQGQRKSFLFALKLAQYHIIKQQKNIKPLLLLDDIFEKLDARRVAHLVQMVCSEEFGQVFITDTDPQRLQEAFADNAMQLQIIRVE